MKFLFFFNRAFEIKDVYPLIERLLAKENEVIVVNKTSLDTEYLKSDLKYLGTFELYLKLSKNPNFKFETLDYSSHSLLIFFRIANSQLDYLRRIHYISYDYFYKLSHRYSKIKIIKRFSFFLKFNFVSTFFEKLLNLIEKFFYQKKLFKFIKISNPNNVIIANLVNDKPLNQNEIIKCCKKLKIKISYIVRSWDNLTNKGRMNLAPDVFFVWNEAQKKEILKFHNFKDSKIIIVGPLLYEHLLNENELIKKETFLNKIGANVANIITYVGSSPQILQNEIDYLISFLQKVISSKILDHNTALIIRMHPLQTLSNSFKNSKHLNSQIEKIDKLLELEKYNIHFIPSLKSNFFEKIDKSLYLNTIYHSDFLIGINTSAMVEAMFYEKITVVPPIPDNLNKKGNLLTHTYHFSYLNNGNDKSAVKIINKIDDLKNIGKNYSENTLIKKFKDEFINLDKNNPPSKKIIEFFYEQ